MIGFLREGMTMMKKGGPGPTARPTGQRAGGHHASAAPGDTITIGGTTATTATRARAGAACSPTATRS